jgi:phosphoribosyl 1,2-cyclic phosphate phosphodiesterase
VRITFLGTGTSQGVPVIACPCAICHSTDKRDKRLRSSILVETEAAHIVIDTGPDFRYQMLRARVQRLDAILFTHGHKDHTAGLDDVRAFNYFQQQEMDVYANEDTRETLKREFRYIFQDKSYPGIPQIRLHELSNNAFRVNGLEVLPIRVLHYKLEVFGFRIGDFSYITDANYIAPEEIDKIRGSRVVVLNALRREPHISHFTLSEAVALAQEIGAETTYLTHISHQLGLHTEVEQDLPANIRLAYDGLQLDHCRAGSL